MTDIVDHRHCSWPCYGDYPCPRREAPCGRAIAPDDRACPEHLPVLLQAELVQRRLDEAYGDGPSR